ncbi:MAG: type 2 isopentenyl-diphosphate Delta-isomerase [Chloroflexi bacterium]|jgi:isopentenyl-diphosphate delta-isomerase|uniref:Isopentenyl-diphosphate delta-isomerase n=1 Tax=Candidatus Thermofonsia Clade 3 bacterium TaxID=2364212 RepID=A0A2M8QBZ5_9CHLR|nr:type 2 isopentenyl-diphosphate Delta-isomerase [Candidatus Roseilinea sp. NK_OTU-006]PJF47312.1 MAG: type 2 isopentenyl-diphosphate Delta-isomerase [Candidatus Thermofonsia Clade 3 bacterium]RMG63179.1 MAG: type 2 isopentenyl-diphosphate Delta-isomerase [Chloroflexota bacterium]
MTDERRAEVSAREGHQLETRKADHIRINLDENVASRLTSGLERYRFMHQALPEIDAREIDMGVTLFGRRLGAPLLISCMTGGTEQARTINRNLAIAAQQARIPMGLGSTRAAVVRPELADTFQVRDVAPDILLFANIGAVQLNYGFNIDDCRRAVALTGADALVLHLNPLQEILQPEGDVNWGGLLERIERVARALQADGIPVIAKEVGWGISPRVARDLANAGVAAIDVAGAGGTSWSQVEMFRARNDVQRRIAEAFVDWGIPTADSIRYVREAAPDVVIFASGGLKNGVDGAKCLALGATLFGMARPFLRAATISPEAVGDEIAVILGQLRAAMLCAGARDLVALRKVELIRM